MVPDLSVRPTVQTRSTARSATTRRRCLSSLDRSGQVELEGLLQQRIAFLVTVGGAGHLDRGLVVVAEPAGQGLVGGHAAARGQRDLEQLARGEHALDVLGADENLRATRAVSGVAARSGAFDPQFRHGLFLPGGRCAEIDGSAEKFERTRRQRRSRRLRRRAYRLPRPPPSRIRAHPDDEVILTGGTLGRN